MSLTIGTAVIKGLDLIDLLICLGSIVVGILIFFGSADLPSNISNATFGIRTAILLCSIAVAIITGLIFYKRNLE